MATESPLLHDGGQCTVNFDARRSSITGTTLPGPNGSGQYLAVALSTTVDRTIALPSTAGSSGIPCYGILQNTPSTGVAADVGIFGVSKAVSGSTAIAPGSDLMLSSTAQGVLIPYSSGAGVQKIGKSLEAATTVGAVFTMVIYGAGNGGGSVA